MKLNKLLIASAFLIITIFVVVFFTNPLEKIKHSRDQQRISDLESLRKGIDFYLTQNAGTVVSTENILCKDCSRKNEVYTHRKIKVASSSTVGKSSQYVNGQGWIPVDLSKNMKPGETPLKILPIDPRESGYQTWLNFPLLKSIYQIPEDFVYTFTAGAEGKYKLTAKMESQDGLEKSKNDDGTLPDRYELGSDLKLKP